MITLRQTFNDIFNDFPRGKSTILSFIKNYYTSPEFRVLLNHRIGKYFYHRGDVLSILISSYYKNRLITKRNCDISYKSYLGSNIRFPHPLGIVIGEGVVIGNNVKIFQQVTLGSHGKKEQGYAYPVVKDNCKIFTGAKLIGGITIGEGAVIGANSVVNIDVPSNGVAVGIPCKILQKK